MGMEMGRAKMIVMAEGPLESFWSFSMARYPHNDWDLEF